MKIRVSNLAMEHYARIDDAELYGIFGILKERLGDFEDLAEVTVMYVPRQREGISGGD